MAMSEKEKAIQAFWDANPEKLNAIREIWEAGRKLNYISLLRAASERPEMAGVTLGHIKAAYEKGREKSWLSFKDQLSDVRTELVQFIAARGQKAAAAEQDDPFADRHENVLKDALAMVAGKQSIRENLSWHDVLNGSPEHEKTGQDEKSKSQGLEM